jgi:GT2 family glycosyltransferase
VSVAFPLYRSAPFVDNICANIDRLTYPHIEIIISDRHGEDDAIGQLERRYGSDPRVRFLRQSDGVDWVAHYNDLLSVARGDYFCWMPHDDVFHAGYVDALAGALDERAAALLAFGVMDAVGVDTPVPVGPFVAPPIAAGERWSLRVALRLLLFWDLFRVTRGLCRRKELLRRRLFVPRTDRTVLADVCWAFAVAVEGPLVFVPDASCTKRYYASSASAGWPFDVREALSECGTMTRALWQSSQPRPKAVGGIAILIYLAFLRILWRSFRRSLGRIGTPAPPQPRSWMLGLPGWLVAPRGQRGT